MPSVGELTSLTPFNVPKTNKLPKGTELYRWWARIHGPILLSPELRLQP